MSKEKRISYFNSLTEQYSRFKRNFENELSHPLIIDEHYTFYPYDKKGSYKIQVLNESVIDSIFRFENPLVLVFASAKNPGGGVTRGSTAQEEEISLHSTWYFQLIENPSFISNFYLDKGSSALNTDKMIYLRNSYMLTNSFYQEISPSPVSFLGVAAPNLSGLQSQGIKHSEFHIYDTLRTRIRNIFKMAIHKKHQTIILGAWGCGVFGLSPVKVAEIFREEIQYSCFNGDIVFSILDKDMATMFDTILNIG